MAHHNQHCVLEISDTGPGVLAEALPRLFDRFYRAMPSGQRSSGLGLAIVAAIIEAHGGHVAARLAQPSGLAITVELPESPNGESGASAPRVDAEMQTNAAPRS
jgi:two-component system OmpR family sensor kinase